MGVTGKSVQGTRIIAGIDEAGLGPLLGPLTLGYSVFQLPPRKLNLWDSLNEVVASSAGRGEERIVIADSKKVYARNPTGRKRLETTALTFLAQRESGAPQTGADILRTAAPAMRPRAAEVARHPWYDRLPPEVPIWCDRGRLELRAEALKRVLTREEVQLLDAGVRVIPAGELNRSFNQTKNKGTTVWILLGAILRHLWEEYGEDSPHVIVDRQGGRFRYGRQLSALFPEARVRVGPETPKQSEYRLEQAAGPGQPARQMRFTFAEKAEDRAFSVALASCLAKYTRELSMEAFNTYFGQLQPNLAPTAGYTQDGRRWVQDAEQMLLENQIPSAVLIRQR
jgi:ribonuclease HII